MPWDLSSLNDLHEKRCIGWREMLTIPSSYSLMLYLLFSATSHLKMGWGGTSRFQFLLKGKDFRSVLSGKVPQMLLKSRKQDVLNLTIYSPATVGNIHIFISDFERCYFTQISFKKWAQWTDVEFTLVENEACFLSIQEIHPL